MNYFSNIEKFQKSLVNVHQTVLFTKSTSDNWVKFNLKNPIQIYGSSSKSLERNRNYYLNFEKEEWKFEAICDILDLTEISQSIIFCNTKNAKVLVEDLKKKDFEVALIVIFLEFS